MDPQATLLLARGPVIALSRTDALGPASSSQSPTGVRCFSVYGTTDKVVNHTENGMATHRTETAAHRRAARYLCLVEGSDLRGAVLRHAPPGRRGGSPVPDCLGRGVVPADRPEGLPDVAGRRTRAERPRLLPPLPAADPRAPRRGRGVAGPGGGRGDPRGLGGGDGGDLAARRAPDGHADRHPQRRVHQLLSLGLHLLVRLLGGPAPAARRHLPAGPARRAVARRGGREIGR